VGLKASSSQAARYQASSGDDRGQQAIAAGLRQADGVLPLSTLMLAVSAISCSYRHPSTCLTSGGYLATGASGASS